MSYNELIKNFSKTRDYMREFYIYGFKSRDEYNKKSGRTYDDERRRMESWLGNYMQFRQTPEGKTLFLSIDSHSTQSNPLYKAWKAKSFTDGDITLHFILMDILFSAEIKKTTKEILKEVDRILSEFETPRYFDESTIRKKLKEYEQEGLLLSEKQGKTTYYKRVDSMQVCDTDALHFFSEVSPCGVIGSFLLDRYPLERRSFSFKHHYITAAMDSEILQMLFEAMHQKVFVMLKTITRKSENPIEEEVVPIKIMISVQSGRQYLMTYTPRKNRIRPYRIDNIISVNLGEPCQHFDELRENFAAMQSNLWGISTQSDAGKRKEYVEFTVRYAVDEPHIHRRLEREKRCGTVERIDEHTSRFYAEVYDVNELIPWIRTFICRIEKISFSNKKVEGQFLADLKAMYRMYDLEGGAME